MVLTDQFAEALGAQLPTGCRIVAAQCVDGKRVYQPATVQYVLTLTEAPTTAHRQQLAAARAALAAGEPIAIQRYRAKKRKWETFDLSPFVEQLAVSADRLTVTCRVSPAGTVRVDELMQWLAVTPAMLREPVRRTAITWQADPDNNLKESNPQCPEKC